MLLTKARSFVARSVPDWLNAPVDRNLLQSVQDALAKSPEPPPSYSPSVKHPHWRRIAKVYAALDQARAQNPQLPTYSALCRHVQDQTGTACSRKLISKWKLDRGLR